MRASHHRTRRVLGAAVAGVMLAAAAAPAHAQPAAPAACVIGSDSASLWRVPVHLDARPADSSAAALRPAADSLMRLVAERIQRAIGAAPGEIRPGDATLGWRDMPTRVDVTLNPDGTFAWRDPHDSTGAGRDSADAAFLLLSRAIAAVQQDGARVAWPSGGASAPASFRVWLTHPDVSPDGVLETVDMAHRRVVFTLPVPWSSPVVPLEPPRIRFPNSVLRSGITGTIVLDFIVTAEGRADLDSVRDIWPEGTPRPTGDLGRAYQKLVSAARDGLRAARYQPARMGGCPMSQLVRQAFAYGLRD